MRETQKAVRAVKCVSPEWKEFHVKYELTTQGIEHSTAGNLGSIGDAITEMPGVANVFVHRYFVTIEKNKTASWPGVEPRIIELLRAMDPTQPIAGETT